MIERELKAARCVIVLWSQASVQSHWVLEEAREGLRRDILVPAKIENVQPPLPFGAIQRVDLIGWKGQRGHPGFKQLMASLAYLLVSSPPPPAPMTSLPAEQPTLLASWCGTGGGACGAAAAPHTHPISIAS
jgi:hypothetical protein